MRTCIKADLRFVETSVLAYWFSQPLETMELLIALTFSVSALFFAWASFGWPLGAILQNFKGVGPPFVSVVATLFALMVTFLSQDIWESNRQALRAINQEREQLLTLQALGLVNESFDADLRAAIRDYVNAVVGLEWKTMEQGEGAPEAAAALDSLTRLVAKAPFDARFAAPMTETALRLRAARESRLSIANAFPDDRKWTAVFLLAFLTQFGVAATHLERVRAQLLAQAIFTAAAVVAMSLVAAVERPFTPPSVTSALPLADILTLVPEK